MSKRMNGLEKDDRLYTYFEIECPCETNEKAEKLLETMTFEEIIDKVTEVANA